MKSFLWVVSLGLASLGGLFLLISMALISNPSSGKDDRDAALGLFIMAVPPLVGGGSIGWILYSRQRQANQAQQQAELEQRQKLFYALVQQNQGRLTVLQFAAAANISGSEAKQYLDQQAKEFGADFTVESAGEVTYLFPL